MKLLRANGKRCVCVCVCVFCMLTWKEVTCVIGVITTCRVGTSVAQVVQSVLRKSAVSHIGAGTMDTVSSHSAARIQQPE